MICLLSASAHAAPTEEFIRGSWQSTVGLLNCHKNTLVLNSLNESFELFSGGLAEPRKVSTSEPKLEARFRGRSRLSCQLNC